MGPYGVFPPALRATPSKPPRAREVAAAERWEHTRARRGCAASGKASGTNRIRRALRSGLSDIEHRRFSDLKRRPGTLFVEISRLRPLLLASRCRLISLVSNPFYAHMFCFCRLSLPRRYFLVRAFPRAFEKFVDKISWDIIISRTRGEFSFVPC